MYAHTSPVHVEVAGERVVRDADVRWCLGLLDHVEELVVAQGRFDPEHREAQLADHRALFARARAVYAGRQSLQGR